MEPFDYTSAFNGVVSPYQSVMQGVQGGAALQQMQAQQQQQAAAQAQAKQMQADLQSLSANPTPSAIGQMMLKYPQLSENLKRGADVLAGPQKQALLDHAGQVYAAAVNGRPDIAAQLLTERATALRNSGDEQGAQATEQMAQRMKDNPQGATLMAGMSLAAAMGPDKFGETFGKLGSERRADAEAPADLAKKQADARIAEADATTKGAQAKYADQTALLDLQKKGWDVENIKSEIGYRKEQNRIAAMNAAAAREGNARKRQELNLKIQEAQTSLNDKVRAKVADAESAASAIDNMLNNVTRILSVAEETKDGKGTGKGTALLRAAAGPLDSRLPTMQGDVADLESLVETLGSQAFLSQIPNIKGMGALSNAEGEKLQSAFQNFSLRQSPEQIIANLKEAQRMLQKGRGMVSKRYGVPLGNPDTPAAAGSRPPLSSFGG